MQTGAFYTCFALLRFIYVLYHKLGKGSIKENNFIKPLFLLSYLDNLLILMGLELRLGPKKKLSGWGSRPTLKKNPDLPTLIFLGMKPQPNNIFLWP